MTLEHHAEDWADQRAALADDPHRPVYHFLPPRYWMNDPNGLIQWQGTYHLFYQHNPHGPLWGGIHWGHATSEDLVHWTDHPIALAPSPSGPDEEGCWSGCAVVHEGVPTILYTGLREGQPGMLVARSRDDNLLAWEKDPRNPVIPAPPEELEVVGFRDHSAWREGEWWYQVIGSGIKGVGGTALLYRSPDLITWDYLHPLLAGDAAAREPLWTGTMWECPDFFALDGKHVLLISVWDEHKLHYSAYMVGTYVDHRFIPETVSKLDFGDNHFYAPQTLLDDQGRRLVWGWIQEGRTPLRQSEAGWSGVMSLPRQLSLGDNGRLNMRPVPELQKLRRNHRRFEDLEVTPGQGDVLAGLRGDTLELMAEWEVGDAAQVGFKVRCAPDGSEETLIFYDAVARSLVVDGERSSLDTQTVRQQHRGELTLQDNVLRLHIFLDRSVIEVFMGGSGCITSRVYPTHADSVGIDLFTIGGTARLVALDVWELASIWPDNVSSLVVPTGSHREGKL